MTELKATVRGYYDTQQLRIQIGGRIIANFKSMLGQAPGEKEEDLKEKAKDVLKKLRNEYRLITDGAADFPSRKKFKGTKLISDYANFVMIANHTDLKKIENRLYREIEISLDDYEIYTLYLKKIKGCGIAMSGVIISEINIAVDQEPDWPEGKKFYVSSLWAYIGIDLGPDGKGRSKRKEHLVDKKYINKKGEEKVRKSITYNPFLKTKMVGVLGGSFLKKKNDPYYDIYNNYKNRLKSNIKHNDKTKGHIHGMANRYMIKMFVADLYDVWRKMEGLPVEKPFAEAKLGIVHKKAA